MKLFSKFITTFGLSLSLIAGSFIIPAPIVANASDNDEILVASFWSQTLKEDGTEDHSKEQNTFFWSDDGVNFYEIASGDLVNYRDTDIMEYADGYIVQTAIDPGDKVGVQMKFTKDFKNFTNVTSNTFDKATYLDNLPSVYDQTWAADSIIDGNTMYTVVSVGTSKMNGQGDLFNQYLLTGTISGVNDQYSVNYSSVQLIALPCVASSNRYVDAVPDKQLKDDHIDGSLYKEGNTFYFAVKEAGCTNEIFKTNSLVNVSDPKNWTLITEDAITNYEGPTLLKYKGNYLLYVDKLAMKGYQSTGMAVTKASIATTGNLDQYTGWLENNQTDLVFHGNNRVIENSKMRHGSVIVVSGAKATNIKNATKSFKYDGEKASVNWKNTGWYTIDKYTRWDQKVWYWYENDVRQGIRLINGELDKSYRGKEICTNNNWYWLDCNNMGAMACNKEVYINYVYSNEDSLSDSNKYVVAQNSVGMEQFIYDSMKNKTGKWVRYDMNGAAIYGLYEVPNEYIGTKRKIYYYDPITKAMAKGWVTIDGISYHFNEVTGILDY